MGASHQLDCS